MQRWSFRKLMARNKALCRVTILDRKILLLIAFRQSWQLVGRYCSHLVPKQDDRTSQIQVNVRLSPSRMVTLYYVSKDEELRLRCHCQVSSGHASEIGRKEGEDGQRERKDTASCTAA